jgi:hypothetical protein
MNDSIYFYDQFLCVRLFVDLFAINTPLNNTNLIMSGYQNIELGMETNLVAATSAPKTQKKKLIAGGLIAGILLVAAVILLASASASSDSSSSTAAEAWKEAPTIDGADLSPTVVRILVLFRVCACVG